MLLFSFARFSLLLRFFLLQNDQSSDMNDLHIKQNRSICALVCKRLDVSAFRVCQNMEVWFMAFLWGHPVLSIIL